LGMQRGIELHLARQKELKKAHPDFQAERKISYYFERGQRKFTIEGRIDGFFPGLIPRIEEIKSTINLHDLFEALSERLYEHPYGLQLLSYGYFYWKESGTLPELNFHLISSRNKKSIDLKIEFELERFESWLEMRLNELVLEAELAEKRLLRREKLANNLAFPFEKPRPGQTELISFIEEGFQEGKNLMLQAPTGLGKTIGVLYPALKEALPRGQTVIYVTPKNSQQLVAEDAVKHLREKGCKVKSLTLTAKSKICMQDEPLCHPGTCEYAKDYYDKLRQFEIKSLLAKKKNFTAKSFKKMAEEFKVCPFELQLEAVNEADTVIGDYNHVFGNKSALSKVSSYDFAMKGKPVLVIDEAHNLPSRLMSHYSPVISCSYLEQISEKLDKKGKVLIQEAQALITSYSSGAKKVIEVKIEPFLKLNERIREYLSAVFDNTLASEEALKFFFIWNEFCEILELAASEERPEFFISHLPDGAGGSLKVTCCDASGLIQGRYQDYEHVVAFSATLKPFDYYAQLTGLKGEKLKTSEFISPYRKDHRKILLIPQVSTKFSERERNYLKIAETISRISSLKSGNYLAFFPSFDFLQKTADLITLPADYHLVKQTRFMRMKDVEKILEDLKSQKKPAVLLAVQGGMFSEGIDYPGGMAIGAFIIGPPLPNFDFEREKMKEYYQANYQEGFEFAYSYPAMAKAVQAAGRIIRSEKDRGIIVLLDNRFLEASYFKTMPEGWFEEHPQELVSSSILQDISHFWQTSD
jgi:DNA excision repair protein ERCC-2